MIQRRIDSIAYRGSRTCQKSLNGLKRIIKIPPAKFESDPCSDKPMAKLQAPRMVTNDVVSIPNLETTITNSNIFSSQFKISAKKFDKVGSNSLLNIILWARVLMNLIV